MISKFLAMEEKDPSLHRQTLRMSMKDNMLIQSLPFKCEEPKRKKARKIWGYSQAKIFPADLSCSKKDWSLSCCRIGDLSTSSIRGLAAAVLFLALPRASGSRSAGNFVFPKVCLVTNTLGTPSFLITFRALLQITLNVFSFKAKRYFFSSLNLKKKHFPSKRMWEWLLEISF